MPGPKALTMPLIDVPNPIAAAKAPAPIAIGSTMVQNAALASSTLRDCAGAAVPAPDADPPDASDIPAGQPMKITTTGSTSTTIAIVAASIAERKPMLPVSDSSSGTSTMPPQGAPL